MNTSTGQKRIRELVQEQSTEYHTYYNSRQTDKAQAILSETHKAFAADPVITQDEITAAPLVPDKYAPKYLRWLESSGEYEELTGNFPPVQLENYIYDAPKAGKKPRYTGGVKWGATLRQLFLLALPQRTVQQWTEAIYYENTGVLRVGMDGRHRLLAHVLWGEPKLTCQSLVIYHDKPDQDLNNALKKLDATSLKYSFPTKRDKKSLLREADSIKWLVAECSLQDLTLILRYANSQYSRLNNRDVYQLIQYLAQLREIQGRSKSTQWYLKSLRRLLIGKHPKPFEQFLIDERLSP